MNKLANREKRILDRMILDEANEGNFSDEIFMIFFTSSSHPFSHVLAVSLLLRKAV